MADIEDKLPENVRGRYYCDDQCIDCDVCRDTSPANFTRQDENGYSYVYKQPETPEEEALCEEALMACPVEAIGDDGAKKEEEEDVEELELITF
ncbi:MAG: ferredoxin [Acidobacteria bacterium]|nr:MAG: ferredoxin [Acidobacteriota bacterium]REK02974.1 MAG: ferredoxin [Acidobacteriota bacterium]REK13222.1 MAG: ferredoxin [Acidobacteriota bacterium]REK41216.1 MAG: ferredoxin [Acidobacteriota bacterium]